jgi:transcriptional regulator with XRE-family HTH domain
MFMDDVTQKRLSDVEIGERLKICRKKRGLTHMQLCELIYALPDNNGKARNEKQIGYIENGNRPLSLEYAHLLSQALSVRYEYLMGWDDYETEANFLLSKMYAEKAEFEKETREFNKKFDCVNALLKSMQYNFGYPPPDYLTHDEFKRGQKELELRVVYDEIMSEAFGMDSIIAEPFLTQARNLLEKGYEQVWDSEFGDGDYKESQKELAADKELEELEEWQMLHDPSYWREKQEESKAQNDGFRKERALWVYDSEYNPVRKFTPEETDSFVNELYDVVTALIQYHITKKKGQP